MGWELIFDKLKTLKYVMKVVCMISEKIKDIDLKFYTVATLFSPSSIDKGTLTMLSVVDFSTRDKVLDLGCGYGTVGILAAKLIGAERVVMCDILPQAVECARINAKLNGVAEIEIKVSNGYDNIPYNDFTLILSNPPYHADFSVPKHFIEVGYRKLMYGGKMVMVTKRLTWYQKKLTAVFGGVKVIAKDGYYIFVAEKRKNPVKKKEKSSNKLSKKLRRKKLN